MSMCTKDNAFKVIVKDKGNLIADYLFERLKDAMIFESDMRKKKYTTELHRVSI